MKIQSNSQIRHIHLIAICGTAMGTLAGILKNQGFEVTGSDEKIYPPMSEMLKAWNIKIKEGFHPENLNPAPDLVIIGNAVSQTNPEVQALLQTQIPYLSMPQAIRNFCLPNKKSLVVAGTHGKTTTTSLLAWVLSQVEEETSFLVGGIPKNFNCSFQLNDSRYFVIEGDEYDTAFFDKGPKFLHYNPFGVILTGIEFDHADIYRDLDHLMGSFQKLLELIPTGGVLLVCGDSPNALQLIETTPLSSAVIPYGLGTTTGFHATDIEFHPEGVQFKLFFKDQALRKFSSPMAGKHNLQNLLGVIGLLLQLKMFEKNEKNLERILQEDQEYLQSYLQKIQRAVSAFEGVRRRQDVRGVARGVTVIDDFAHHPTAVAETIDAIRKKYPNQKIWAVFEPRSNTSRRAVFQAEFAKAFTKADEVLIAKVHAPEKVKDAALLDLQALGVEINAQQTPARVDLSVEAILEILQQETYSNEVVLIMSNGGFENIHERILEKLRTNAR